MNTPDNATFLETLFEGCEGHIATGHTYTTSAGDVVYPMTLYDRNAHASWEDATHFCVGTLNGDTNASGNPARTMKTTVHHRALVLDDVGTKGAELDLEPTASIETKPGNFTEIFKLTRPITSEVYERIMAALIADGRCDENCGDRERLMRLPNSLPDGKEHRATLATFDPTITYDPDTFLELAGVPPIQYERHNTDRVGVPAPRDMLVSDPVLAWLQAEGHDISEEPDGWHKIRCPWHAEHSDHRNIAKYKPATNLDVVRMFYCHHTHGQNAADFLKWVADNGGPDVDQMWTAGELDEEPRTLDALTNAGVTSNPTIVAEHEAETEEAQQADDDMQNMLDRYALYAPRNSIIDLHQPETAYSLQGFRSAHKHLTVSNFPNNGRTELVTRWLQRPDKMVTMLPPHLDPTQPAGWTGEFVNTYRKFERGTPIDNERRHFKNLVAHVFPDDMAYALDWMAHKLQHPEHRMVALLNYTPTFGTGRSSLMRILGKLLVHSTLMQAEQLLGKSNTENGYMRQLLVTVGEVDTAGSDPYLVRRDIYNKLKEIVDPDETHVELRMKYMSAETIRTFTSFMLATNKANGIPLEKGDRRFSVCRGNDMPLRDAHPEVIQFLADADSGKADLTAVYDFLMERDLSKFNPSVPLVNKAKDDVIDSAKSILQQDIEDVLDDVKHAGIVTVEGVMRMLRCTMAEAYRSMPETTLRNHVTAVMHDMSEPTKRMSINEVRHRPRRLTGAVQLHKNAVHFSKDPKHVKAALVHFLTNVDRIASQKPTRPFGVGAVVDSAD